MVAAGSAAICNQQASKAGAGRSAREIDCGRAEWAEWAESAWRFNDVLMAMAVEGPVCGPVSEPIRARAYLATNGARGTLERAGARLIPVIVAAAALLGGCAADSSENCAPDLGAAPAVRGRQGPERFEFVRVIMGVEARIVLHAAGRDDAFDAANQAFARLSQLDEMMSDYRPGSELSRLCRATPGVPHPASAEMLEVLTVAEKVSQASDGAFDATVGPAVALWRAARKSGVLPTEAERTAAVNRVGWRSVVVDSARGTVTLAREGIKLDFGGIAKGFAAEQGVLKLKRLGYGSCLVALAGDIATGDAPPGADGWKVEVMSGRKQTGRVLVVSNTSISTSGDAEQFVDIDGQRYSHIVDPRTGLGTPGGVAVTVVGRPGAVVDALGKALVVPGARRLDDAALVLMHFPECAAIAMTPGLETDGSDGWRIFDPKGTLRFAPEVRADGLHVWERCTAR